MSGRVALRLCLVVVAALIIQDTVMLNLRIAGIHPDIMVLVPVTAGVLAGPEYGAAMGFVAGMATDLLLPTPFGLSALVYTLVGFGVGAAMVAGEAQRQTSWWLTPLLALAGTATEVMVFAVLGAVLGQPQMVEVNLAATVTVVAVANAILAPVATLVVAWALDQPVARRRRRGRLMDRSLGGVR